MKITVNQLHQLVKAGFTPQIKSKNGLTDIIEVYDKNGPGRELTFENGQSIKIADNHKMFIGEKWIEAISLSIDDIVEPHGKIVSIVNTKSQRWIDFSVRDVSETYYHKDILHHNSGKSVIIYSKIRYHLDKLNHNVVLIVPTTQLVQQMYSDFADYSSNDEWNVEDNCQMLYSGKEKIFSRNVMISTWQSLTALSKHNTAAFIDIANRTDCIIMDEAHTYSSDVVLSTMNKFTTTKWRTGTTGTLDDSKINKLQLIGLMSEPYQVITTKQLMDQGSVVKLDIKMLQLVYPDHMKDAMKGMDYKTEIDFLVTFKARNKMIAEVATMCKGVTLVLFTFIEKHGAILNELITASAGDRKVRFIHGKIDVDAREEVRQLADSDPDCIIIASSSIFSTGTNIPSIENVIFAMPTKSTIRVRQSIGRGLRLRNGKNKCTLFDISDDLSVGSYRNTTLNHMYKRMEIYDKEQFDYTVNKIAVNRFMDDSPLDVD